MFFFFMLMHDMFAIVCTGLNLHMRFFFNVDICVYFIYVYIHIYLRLYLFIYAFYVFNDP